MVNAETGVIAAICELTGVHRATRRAVLFPVEVGAAFLAGV
jgi:hypothetical protein